MTVSTATPATKLNKRRLFADLGYVPHPGQLEVHLSDAPRRVLACGVRWGKCVVGTAEVYDLASGRRRGVSELGQLAVQSWDGTLRARRSNAEAFASGRKPCVRVCLESGQQAELSEDHPVRTARGWVPAAMLVPRELVATPRWLPEPDHPLRVSDQELVVLGALLMDGGTSQSATTYTKLPGPMLDLFTRSIEALGGHVSERAGANSGKAKDLSVSGIGAHVRRWGLRGCTSRTKRLPAELYGLATDQVGRLLGIMFAGDGWFEENKAAITLANRLLLEDIRHLLLRIGVHARIRRSDRKLGERTFEAWTLRVTGSANLGRFIEHVNVIPGREEALAQLRSHAELGYRCDTDLVPIGVAQGAAIATELGVPRSHVTKGSLGFARPTSYVTRDKFGRACEEMGYTGSLRYLAETDVLWSRVRSVEPIGEQDVYDLSVPGDENFACCNVIVHNTRCAAMEGIAAALEPAKQSIGWVVAPTYDLADKVFRELVVIAAENLRHRIVHMKEHERKLVLRNLGGGLSEIRGKSSDNPVSLLGEGLNWLVVDEAARMTPKIWESHLSQRLIDKKGWALLISTPKGKGWFYETWRRGQGHDDAFESWNLPSWINPHLDATVIEAERDRLPERVYRQEYGGEFLEGSGQVFRNVRECATGELQAPQPHASYKGGLDLAKVQDFTVLVILNRANEVVFVDRFNRLDWNLQVGRIVEATRRYGNAWTLTDSTGKGEPVLESLIAAGCAAEGYAFTNKSKAALIDNLALMLEKREIVLPRPELWPEGLDELESFEYSVTDSGTVRTGAPGGCHDDAVIALALAAWNARLGDRRKIWFF